MEIKVKRQQSMPLIASYVGSVYMYTMFTSMNERILVTLFLVAIIATFSYSLYKIWHEHASKERIQLFKQLALFAVVLHAITIPINYFFGGIIGFLVGLLIIYLFSKKVVST